ncbi:MAG: hypothetical protein KY455_02045 [Euryarchaeota archaeon]|nr:hypothetical protein [Euryarchaeota archaeon]
MPADGKLLEDALRLAVDKNLADIRTLLAWAERSDGLDEKLRHIGHALELLAEVKENLEALR